MLTQTGELGIQIMLFLALRAGTEPVVPRQIAELTGASPTYTAKVTGLLVKAGLLKAQRGAHGGVLLARPPAELTLLQIVEACQGRVLADYCQPYGDLSQVCAYHRAMHELHEAITDVLTRWTLGDLAAKPIPGPALKDNVKCRLQWCRSLLK